MTWNPWRPTIPIGRSELSRSRLSVAAAAVISGYGEVEQAGAAFGDVEHSQHHLVDGRLECLQTPVGPAQLESDRGRGAGLDLLEHFELGVGLVGRVHDQAADSGGEDRADGDLCGNGFHRVSHLSSPHADWSVT